MRHGSRKQPHGGAPIGAAPTRSTIQPRRSAEQLRTSINTYVFNQCMRPNVTAGVHIRELQAKFRGDVPNETGLVEVLNEMTSAGTLCYGETKQHYHVSNVWDWWDEDLNGFEHNEFDQGWE